MIERRADCLAVTVPLTMANARGLLDAGRALLQPGVLRVDLSAVTEADSSAVALMLGLVRAAQPKGCQLSFTAIPVGVLSLIELYGVAELLTLA